MSPLTLEDIAQISGVSRSTVSRVINCDDNVKDKTREKVMEVIQKYNFQPNLAARGLAAGRTNIIGLVIPAAVSTIFTDPYFPLLTQGVSSACNVNDFSVMLWLAEPEYERRMVRRIIHSGLLDGVIVSSTLMEDPIIRALIESKMQFVLIGRYPGFDSVNILDVDNETSGQDATMHLIRSGRKRVATITGPQNMIAGFDRFQGYKAALSERGIPFSPELVSEGDFSEMSGYLCMRNLLPSHPDAVFAASDMMAIGAMRAIAESGLRVPEDIAIVGFDDLPVAKNTNPALTSIRQPITRMGSLAVETLIDRITHPDQPPRRIILATELVIRNSCGTVHPGKI
ncbi:MAG: LacI family transcriptional regulator [Anaerolineaceae bacterium]|nr:LacI family transcriptional regulator [Anaerolineaceae bacterium]